jgi:hypothetical protein
MKTRPRIPAFTRRAFFIALAALLSFIVAALPAQAAEDPEAFLKSEQLGGLKLNLPEKDVLKLLGNPQKKGTLMFQEADGEWVQDWEYPDAGLSLTMSAKKKGGAKTIAHITATAPCALATKAGIKIGSPAAEVSKVYKGHLDKENPPTPKHIVAGSIYGGLMFDLEKGKVTRIFIGAAAE